jgi:molybdenum cofactor cytidylyltransferase
MAEPAASRVFAIVPAAGRSRRMTGAKQLLEVAGRPMLVATLEPLAAARVAGVLIVTHRDIAAQLDLSHLPGVVLAGNEDETSEMIDSVRIALRAWYDREAIADYDGFLVCPADQPGITTEDFDTCLTEFREAPNRIIIAARGGRHGHPIIFPAGLRAFVESQACDTGLHALPRTFAKQVVYVECRSEGVIRDIDTPRDYDKLK